MSYVAHFGLDQPPFSTSPDPAFIYLTDQHKRAFYKCRNAIGEQRGIVLVHGDIGLGKTTISRALYNQLRYEDDQHVASLVRSNYNSELEFLISIANEFNIPEPGDDISSLYNSIEYFLITSKQNDKKAVLLLDEAQTLPQVLFETLRTLLNYEHDSFKLLQIMLFAQEEILDVLTYINSFEDRIASYVPLVKLSRDDSDALIEHRWQIAGGSMHPFDDQALQAIFELSEGRPRKICALCHDALMNAEMRDGSVVTREDVELAARERGMTLPDREDSPDRINDSEGVQSDTAVDTTTPITNNFNV